MCLKVYKTLIIIKGTKIEQNNRRLTKQQLKFSRNFYFIMFDLFD